MTPSATAPLPDPVALQATLVDFAIAELVRARREAFLPLWTVESWAKLLIALALACGCPGEREALEVFAQALGPDLTGRMRRLFFGRELEELNLRLLADPAEERVLALPLDPAATEAAGSEAAASAVAAPDAAAVATALERVGLADRVAGPERWEMHEALVAIPWSSAAP